jgi:hypothetical protein
LAPRRVTHQSTPNPHPVIVSFAGAVFVCFRLAPLTRFHWLKNCKKLPFSEPKQLIEAETRFG